MKNFKAILNIQTNYGVLETTTTPRISYYKYLENIRRITLKPRYVPYV